MKFKKIEKNLIEFIRHEWGFEWYKPKMGTLQLTSYDKDGNKDGDIYFDPYEFAQQIKSWNKKQGK